MVKGSCNCGAVSFSIKDPLPAMYQCHCSLCQKQSGTGSNAATIVHRDHFSWLSGESTIKQWRKRTGFSSHFCSDCGSPVPNPVASDFMWIPVGLIGNYELEIVAHLWLSSKSNWDRPQAAVRNYDGMPEDLTEFVSFLKSHKNQ